MWRSYVRVKSSILTGLFIIVCRLGYRNSEESKRLYKERLNSKELLEKDT